jgi:hypothetical protein
MAFDPADHLQRGTISPEVRAQAEMAAQSIPFEDGYRENDAARRAEIAEIAARAEMRSGGALNDDQSSCHYARGSTVVVHIFISRPGSAWQVWDEDARDDQAAKAQIAKDYFLGIAPPGVAMSFDHPEGDAYWWGEVALPDTTTEISSAYAELALSSLGVSDIDGDGWIIDDYSRNLQSFDGGYDNAIVCFHLLGGGRAWASYAFARTALYIDSSAMTIAHEWGHLFGSCDEYSEFQEDLGATTCNYDMNCGECQSTYLDDQYYNGNCELAQCPDDTPCLMKSNNQEVCGWTRQHWSWEDENGDGQFDHVTRRVQGETFVPITEVWPNGYVQSTSSSASYAAHVTGPGWTAIALRSPGSGDYDLELYGENNHTYEYASSHHGTGDIDLIVVDHNHTGAPSVVDLEVSRFSGSGAYTLNWSPPGSVLYPDGVIRNGSWYDGKVVQVWDLPLFGAEEITIDLDVLSGGLDLGMALFKSSGSTYYGVEGSALWKSDEEPGGETHTFVVPGTDVYGLVVWSNAPAEGTFSVRVGPSPVTLAEDLAHTSGLPLRLYDVDPEPGSWGVVATRPDPGISVTLRAYADPTYETHGATSAVSGDAVELILGDFHVLPPDPVYLRVIRVSATGNYRTEFEQGADVHPGYIDDLWSGADVVEVWDVNLEADQEYLFRQYHPGLPVHRLETGIFLFAPGGPSGWRNRSQAVASSDVHFGGEGGEWFSHTPTVTGTHALVMTERNGIGDAYSFWWGPRMNVFPDAPLDLTHPVLFGTTPVQADAWVAWAARSDQDAELSLALAETNTYTDFRGVSPARPGVNVIVADRNIDPSFFFGWLRVLREGGVREGMDVAVDLGHAEDLVFTPGGATTTTLAWSFEDVVAAFDLPLDHDTRELRPVGIRLVPLTGGLDLGLAVFDPGPAATVQGMHQAVGVSDNGGPGEDEVLVLDLYGGIQGVVVTSAIPGPGTYRIEVFDPDMLEAPEADLPRELAFRTGANPVRGAATFHLALPEAREVRATIHDVHGRRIRSLASGSFPAGRHALRWDGRDDGGRRVGAGVYVGLVDAGGAVLRGKVVLTP